MNRVVESFPLALEAVRRVMDKNDEKKADEPWADQAPNHHLVHAVTHVEESITLGVGGGGQPTRDTETGERHVAHAIARLLMYLELLERSEDDVE